MDGIRIAAWMMAASLLAGCANEPTITDTTGTKPAPGQVVALCYNASNTSRSELATLALEQCQTGATGVTPWEHDSLMNNCPITKRNRITFLCRTQ